MTPISTPINTTGVLPKAVYEVFTIATGETYQFKDYVPMTNLTIEHARAFADATNFLERRVVVDVRKMAKFQPTQE